MTNSPQPPYSADHVKFMRRFQGVCIYQN